MGTTGTYALRYADSTSNVQLWDHFQNLATDVENTLLTRFGVIARWRRETSVTGVTSETGIVRIDSIAFKGGVYYTIETNSIKVSTASGETASMRIRLSTAGTATTASAQIGQTYANANTAFVPSQTNVMVAEYAPVADATGSVILTLARVGGSGSCNVTGSATEPIILMVKAWGKAVAVSGVDL